MSPILLKIYAFLVMITLIITGSLLHKEKYTPKIINTVNTTKDTILENSNAIIKSVQFENNKRIPADSKVTQIPETYTEESDYEQSTQRANSCASTIFYTLGSFDSRFALSKTEFLKIINESVAIWNEALGKKLFVYTDSAKASAVSVNLIYDNRQAQTDANKLLSIEIDNSSKAASALEMEYTEMKVTFSKLKDEYAELVQTFNARQKKYNDTVAMWNEQGGAPRSEYEVLTQEKADLQKIADELLEKQQIISTLLTAINTKITRHNELVLFANQRIDENNNSANKKFTEGVYSSGSNRITIYQFSDRDKLKRVLTHEFGHALGIDHVTNKESIMYSINTATTTTLSTEDKEALSIVCSE